jgi:ATP phosphoribosyltransferase regulatory subunit
MPSYSAPPPGTQDLLFEAARRLRRCEAALASLFEGAGYAEAIPPLIERASVFDAPEAAHQRHAHDPDSALLDGGPLAAEKAPPGPLRAVDNAGQLLAFRADFTAQIARIAATRLSGVSPLRLYYRGPVVRESGGSAGELRERLQAGCELVGESDPRADAELLSLVAAAPGALGIPAGKARLSIGTVAWFSALVEAADASPRLSAALSDAIDRKDRPTLERLCRAEVLPGKARDALLLLTRAPVPELGAQALLEEARALAPSKAALAALDRLSATLPLLRSQRSSAGVEVDLGEVRGLGYYTGLVFNLYAEGAPRAVGGGGRYDTLLGRFGDPRPAVGFTLDLDALVPLAALEAARPEAR